VFVFELLLDGVEVVEWLSGLWGLWVDLCVL